MLLLNLSGLKGRLVLGSLLVSALISELDAQEQKTAVGTKPKLRSSTNKVPKPGSAKPKIKPTPSAQSQTSLTQVLNRGKFKKVGETLSVQTGDTLELRCRGKPVQWSVPLYLEEDDDGRLRIVQHERYNVLTLVNTTGADTGEYICYPMFCEDQDCRKEYNKAAKVFIFFPDPQELFVPSSNYYEMIQLRSNWPTVLPCQVTSPEVKVTLYREFPPAQVAVDGTEISFEVKKGFTIHRPRPSHAGVLYCVASLGDLRQSSIKYILIYVNYPMMAPAPVIQASSSSVAMGENLHVTCTVMGEQDVNVEFNWEYPGQEVALRWTCDVSSQVYPASCIVTAGHERQRLLQPIGRPLYTQESVSRVSGGGARQQSQSILLVDEVRDVDQGTYTCTAENLQGAKSVSTTVKVLPKAKAKKQRV